MKIGRSIRRTKLEKEWEAEGPFAGCDEVGVSAVAGKLLACALILPAGLKIKGVRDSKLVPTHKERLAIAEEIKKVAIDYSFGWVEPEEVSNLGTFKASILAMERAVKGLKKIPSLVVTDFHKLDLPDGIHQVNMVKADRKIFSVAAASILAKATRDTYMKKLHEKFPMYGWDTGVGYRTRRQWEALREYGLSPHHRVKYATVWSKKQVVEYKRQRGKHAKVRQSAGEVLG